MALNEIIVRVDRQDREVDDRNKSLKSIDKSVNEEIKEFHISKELGF